MIYQIKLEKQKDRIAHHGELFLEEYKVDTYTESFYRFTEVANTLQ